MAKWSNEKTLGVLFAGAFAGVGTVLFADAIKKRFVLRDMNYPFWRAIGVGSLSLLAAYLVYQTTTQSGEEGEGTEQYGGLIIDPEKVRKTCYCEMVCTPKCFAQGAIGALSKEQVKKYCPEWWEKIWGKKQEGTEITLNIPKGSKEKQKQKSA